MSKHKKTRATKTFRYTATHKDLPKTPRVKTEWDLKTLYYRSEKDPQIEKDLRKAERAYHRFTETYRGKNFAKSAAVLHTALKDAERIGRMPELTKSARYFAFRSALNTNDSVAEKSAALIAHRLQKAANETLFFEIELGALSKKRQRELLADPTLSAFQYYLKRVFDQAAHDLSEAEERILNLKSGPAYSMWVNATEKIIGGRSILYKKKKLSLYEAIEHIDALPSKEKPKLWSAILAEMEQIGTFAENEFSAILTDARIDDELRNYEKPYSAAVLAHEDKIESVEALLAVVRTEGFRLSKKFYKLKAKYHNVPAIPYVQKYDSIGTTTHIPFNEAVTICRDIFYGLKREYGEIFDRMLERGQVDVYAKEGKRGGAFMSGAINLPTHVFLNHTDTFKSLETLAHEMGHAIHTERSKRQPIFYQDHSTTTAETASTLFENLVFDAVYAQASDTDKEILLHDRITRDIATIQRQIAFFDTELEMHTRLREQGALTNTELRDIMTKHLRAYLGNGVSVTPEDGYSYVYVPHFRFGFYVYTYTFGILMSTIMASNYREDPSYIKKIDTFLSAGRSADVAGIFKSIGIDTTRKDTFITALQRHAADVSAFEKLTRRHRRQA